MIDLGQPETAAPVALFFGNIIAPLILFEFAV